MTGMAVLPVRNRLHISIHHSPSLSHIFIFNFQCVWLEGSSRDCSIIENTFDRYTIDFTPSDYISLLFTDLGVLTPAAVSDELINLYK